MKINRGQTMYQSTGFHFRKCPQGHLELPIQAHMITTPGLRNLRTPASCSPELCSVQTYTVFSQFCETVAMVFKPVYCSLAGDTSPHLGKNSKRQANCGFRGTVARDI
jgi:hypothetical protein